MLLEQKMKYCPLCAGELAFLERDQKRRLACANDSCDFVYWDNPVSVVAAIVQKAGKVVLARNSLWPEGKFALIAGFLEKDETPEQAVLREVEEELGVCGKIEQFVGHYSFFEKNQLLFVYEVSITGEIILSEELAEIKMLFPQEIKPWPQGTGIAVKDWLASRGIF